jgi:hypothetical protein
MAAATGNDLRSIAVKLDQVLVRTAPLMQMAHEEMASAQLVCIKSMAHRITELEGELSVMKKAAERSAEEQASHNR